VNTAVHIAQQAIAGVFFMVFLLEMFLAMTDTETSSSSDRQFFVKTKQAGCSAKPVFYLKVKSENDLRRLGDHSECFRPIALRPQLSLGLPFRINCL
jgi:hypothetical protein